MAEDPGKQEIRSFLKILRPMYVGRILDWLYDYYECDDMESVVVISREQWSRIFKEVGLLEGQQVKLLNALNELRIKKDLKPLNIGDFREEGAEKPDSNSSVLSSSHNWMGNIRFYYFHFKNNRKKENVAVLKENIAIPSGVNDNTSRIVRICHLVESIYDEESFQFARQAIREMIKELPNSTKQLQSLFQEIVHQFKDKANIKSIYQITFVSEQLGEQRQYLSPLELFYLVKYVTTAPMVNIEIIKREFLRDVKRNLCGVKVEGFHQFMLIPSFNLLADKNTVQINDTLLRHFDFKNIKKVSQMASRCMDIVETDVKIRRILNISPILFAEVHLMQILHSQNDSILSKEILELLLSNKEFMTAEIWVRLWTTQDSKCADVICKLYQCHFEKWSQLVDRLQNIGALKIEQVCKKLLRIFNEKNFQDIVLQSNQDFISFVSFVLKYDTVVWQNWESVLQTLNFYIENTNMIYHIDTLMAIFNVLWRRCPFDFNPIETQVITASQRLLRRLVIEEKSLALWLQLFTYQIQEEKKHTLKSFLSQSLCEWINNKMVGKNIDSPQQLVNLMSYLEFWCLPGEYQITFLTEIEKQKEALFLSSKKWNEKSLEVLKKCLEKTFIDWKLLNRILEVIVDIPVQMNLNVIDEIEENKEEMCKKENKSKLLIYHLEYCFLCVPWLPLIQCQSNKVRRLKQLQDLMKITFNVLFEMVENESIAFCVCEFLGYCDDNNHNIQAICRSFPEWKDKVDTLLNVLKKFQNFVLLKQLYTVVSANYMTIADLSERLQEFSQFCSNWDLESFLEASRNYHNEQNTFQKLQEAMKYLVDMKDSCIFKKLWIQYRREMNEQTKLTFETSMDKIYNHVCKKMEGVETGNRK
ncbi:hypothetical protein RFI_25025 [Reticulomyxa filosa]|uniref:Uncharacterized protein n=1 Tax=Reticulomyxa filosa TaxID=46433 RepID=X6MFC9_RETFI|nr:hypothetical protein RFI_25025 [Reticulomyxa filosa]|eukprot:ETO12351.1 hypothetical protein RFI_25025 [Reticulomyxa filosa]